MGLENPPDSHPKERSLGTLTPQVPPHGEQSSGPPCVSDHGDNISSHLYLTIKLHPVLLRHSHLNSPSHHSTFPSDRLGNGGTEG